MISRRTLPAISLGAALFFVLYTCKDMGVEPQPKSSAFSADSTSLHIVKGSLRLVTLTGGTQPYSIKTEPNSAIATASLSSWALTISAVDTGNTFIVLKDTTTPVPDTVRITIGVYTTTPVPTVHFSTQIQPIFNSICTGCHGGSGGLYLSSNVSYANLVNVQAQSSCTSMKRVLPGDASNSVLYRKVSGSTCGAQMPQGGNLSTSQIKLIQDWINEGAQNN